MKTVLEVLAREAVYIWYYFDIQLRQIFLYWAVGIVLGSCVSVFAKNWIHTAAEKVGQRVPGIVSLVIASALGIASPLCMYGTIPVCAAFSRKGIKDDFLAAFMMSSILLNPQLILYSTALGGALLAVRVVSCFVCGIVAGLLVRAFFCKGILKQVQNDGLRADEGLCSTNGGRADEVQTALSAGGMCSDDLARPKSYFDFSCFDEPHNRDTDPNIFLRLLKNIWRNVRATALWFFVGVLLSALFQRYVPAEAMAALFGKKHEGFGILLAATVGVPLYVCGGGTIPLILQWLSNGMSAGSAAAFMITGPATKITNLGALKIALGLRNFLLYILFVMIFSLLTGLLVNCFL